MADPIRWYMDEHVPRAVTDGLRRRGIDVTTTQDAGNIGISDEAQLAYATNDGRAVFTRDADFLRLHAVDTAHAGIVYIAQGASIGVIVRGLLEIGTLLDASDMMNWLEFL